MGKTIVFVNQKGGVGKTTSAINIGAYIAKRKTTAPSARTPNSKM